MIVLDGFRFGGEADGLKEAEGTDGDDIGSVVRDFEGDSDVGLGRKVVDLTGEEEVDPSVEGEEAISGAGRIGALESNGDKVVTLVRYTRKISVMVCRSPISV